MKGIRPRNLLSEENGAGTHCGSAPWMERKQRSPRPVWTILSAKGELLLDQGLFDRDDDGV
jgi:hypothetical protein